MTALALAAPAAFPTLDETLAAPINREDWLRAFARMFAPRFEALGAPLPAKIRFSCGFPAGSRTAIGQCWSSDASADAHFEIFVSPVLDDASRVADVLVHELVHAAVGIAAGHGPKFRKVAKGLGLTGKMTATVATEQLKTEIAVVVKAIGDYPHAALGLVRPAAPQGETPAGETPEPTPRTSGPKKQRARQLKVACPCCDYKLRGSRTQLDRGTPFCPEHFVPMIEETSQCAVFLGQSLHACDLLAALEEHGAGFFAARLAEAFAKAGK